MNSKAYRDICMCKSNLYSERPCKLGFIFIFVTCQRVSSLSPDDLTDRAVFYQILVEVTFWLKLLQKMSTFIRCNNYLLWKSAQQKHSSFTFQSVI